MQLIDPYWTFIPVLIAHFYSWACPNAHVRTARQLVALGLIWLWAIRLTHSYFRRCVLRPHSTGIHTTPPPATCMHACHLIDAHGLLGGSGAAWGGVKSHEFEIMLRQGIPPGGLVAASMARLLHQAHAAGLPQVHGRQRRPPAARRSATILTCCCGPGAPCWRHSSQI